MSSSSSTITQIDNVVRIKSKGERVSGCFLLFATHFIYVDAKGDEIWVRSPHLLPCLSIIHLRNRCS